MPGGSAEAATRQCVNRRRGKATDPGTAVICRGKHKSGSEIQLACLCSERRCWAGFAKLAVVGDIGLLPIKLLMYLAWVQIS